MRRPLLATTAAIGMGLGGGGATAVRAAEVLPGGELDVTVSGFIGFLAHSGDLDKQRNNAAIYRGLDFSNDTELHILVEGKDDTTGIEYGGTIELEADTNRSDNADETWIFVRGGFGEFRFGDEDGVVDNSAIGASTIAAGTGGIDGDVIDRLEVDAVLPSNSDDATKIRYYTPSFGGFQLGVSYTPNLAVINAGDDNGDTLAARAIEGSNLVEGALVYDNDSDELRVRASVVGSLGKAADPDALAGSDAFWTYYGGFAIDQAHYKLGAGYGDENVGGQKRRYFNAGVAAPLGPAEVSLTYGQVLSTHGYEGVGAPWNVVLSADVDLVSGLVLMGDVAYFNNDLDKRDREIAGESAGWVWVARLDLAF